MNVKKVIIGLLAGFISGFFASGGGMILVPALVYFLNTSEIESRATSTYCIIPIVIISAVFYFKGNYIDWGLAILCAIGGIVGGIIGTKLLMRLSDNKLKILFSIFLIYMSTKMIFNF